MRKMRSESSHMTFSTVLGRFSMAMFSSRSFCHSVLSAWLGLGLGSGLGRSFCDGVWSAWLGAAAGSRAGHGQVTGGCGGMPGEGARMGCAGQGRDDEGEDEGGPACGAGSSALCAV